MKRNKGITLIALVITIIVLLILAGVAISMLSGENGILNKAREAKEKTEEGQKDEETTLADYELDMYFIANNSKYKCRYGIITGFEAGTDTVKNLKDDLPKNENYEIFSEDGQPLSETKQIGTGMIVKKDKEPVARTVIFGDVNGLEGIEDLDLTDIMEYVKSPEKSEQKYYAVYAMDVNHDGFINSNDVEFWREAREGKKTIKQNVYAQKSVISSKILDTEVIANLAITKLSNIEKKNDVAFGEDCYEVELNQEYTYKAMKDKIEKNNPGYTVNYSKIENNTEVEIDSNSESNILKGEYIIIELPKVTSDSKIPESSYIVLKVI